MRAAALTLAALLAAAAPAAATVIAFDDGAQDASIGGFYSGLGVTFAGASWQPNFGLVGFTGALGMASDNLADPFRYDTDAPILASFATAMDVMSVGVLDLGENGFTLRAYDAAVGGNLIASATLYGIGLGNNNYQVMSLAAPGMLRVEMSQVLDFSADGVILESFSFSTVPEPGTLGLLALGLAGIAGRRRRAG